MAKKKTEMRELKTKRIKDKEIRREKGQREIKTEE